MEIIDGLDPYWHVQVLADPAKVYSNSGKIHPLPPPGTLPLHPAPAPFSNRSGSRPWLCLVRLSLICWRLYNMDIAI